MSWEKSLEILRRAGVGTGLRHLKTAQSSVTTAWGVDWDEELIARDLMQNFYDANRERVAEVRVTVEAGGTVVVAAPAEYNLERFFYLGSEKGPGDVGQYGEGFKVAATCLLRDHRVTPIATSGSQVVCMRIADEPVEGTALFPLVYDFFTSERPVAGTQLILPSCSRRLADAMRGGLTHFYYEGNPLVGERLWSSANGQFAVHRAAGGQGHVFYCGLRRGQVPDVPVILVIHQQVKMIENRIKNDRDRNAFGEKLMETFYKEFAKKALRWNRPGQRVVIEAARACWARGHGLVSAIAGMGRSWDGSLWDEKLSREVFGDSYFARPKAHDTAMQLEYDRLERAWQAEGRQGLPGYFAQFGVPSAARQLAEQKEKARQESMRTKSRAPTAAEANSIRVLKEILGKLSPAIMGVLGSGRTGYTVAATDAVLGELKRGRSYREREVFLAEQVLVADFSEALAVFLHEHAHIFGYDGSRGFTDALTELLETVVRHRRELNPYERDWEAAKRRVLEERCEREQEDGRESLQERLAAMGEAQLRELVGRLPPVTLKRLLSDSDD
jgi:hypothetical protein